MRYLFFLILFAISACAPVPLKVPPVDSETLKETLFEQLAANARTFTSLKGVVKMKIAAPEKTVSGSHALFLEKPASLRAETMNPFGFGLPIMLTVTDGRELSVFIPSQGDFYRGEATPENLMRLFPVPLRVEDLVRFLLYEVPVIEHESMDVKVEETGYLLTLTDVRGIKQTLRFDAQRRLVEAEIYAQDQILFSLKYASFEGVPSFPKVASLEMPPQQVKVSVVYSDITLNTDIPDEKFILPLPDGVEERPFP